MATTKPAQGDSPILPVIDMAQALAKYSWGEYQEDGKDGYYHRIEVSSSRYDGIIAKEVGKYYRNHIEIWTGRPESLRQVTEQWLRDHRIPFHDLRMRVDGDFRSAKITKKEWMEEYGVPDIMFEDRKEYVDFYRDMGICVMDVAGHGY